jgi:hypothetical protein
MSVLPECARKCKEHSVSCPNTECNMWIDYESENNCCLVSIEEKGKDGSSKGLTLHECADRLQINYLKVRQIEINALRKMSNKREVKDLMEDLNDEF